MRRLLIPVATTVLCLTGAGLASAAIAPVVHRSSVARLMTSSLHGDHPATPSPGLSSPLPVISSPLAAAATPVPAPADQAAVQAKVTQAAQDVLPNAQVGFEIFDRADGTVLASHGADQQFPSMSVVKLLIALDALVNDEPSEASTQHELHQMLANSDDAIANELWSAGGGPAIVTRMVNLLGLSGTRPPGDPGEWGDTLITPQDMVAVYRYITDQLPRSEQDLILGALSEAPEIAADGFNQYFGIPDGMPGIGWAVKQGWGTSGSQAVMNTTGLVGPDWCYVVVVLAAAPASSYSTVPAAVTAGAAALADLVSAAGP